MQLLHTTLLMYKTVVQMKFVHFAMIFPLILYFFSSNLLKKGEELMTGGELSQLSIPLHMQQTTACTCEHNH